jgi:hypothetical protein
LSLIIVVARPQPESGRDEPTETGVAWLREVLADGDDLSIAYATSPGDAVIAAEQAVAEGRTDVAVVPVTAEGPQNGREPSNGLAELPGLLSESASRHAAARIGVVSGEAASLSVSDVLRLVSPSDRDNADLLAEAIQRAFDGDTERFGRFVQTLQQAMPPGTQIGLRGSVIQGYAYKSQEPFDARGRGTSDLDVVLFGDEVMAAFHPEAFVVPGVNTLPLSDGSVWVAPTLESARSAAQAIARRPVSLQAMARWFMDLRSGIQGQPYVVLDAR